MSLISTSSLLFTITLSNLSEFRLYLLFADIFAVLLTCIVIWEVVMAFTGKCEAHGHIVNDSYQLRDQSINFLQNRIITLIKKAILMK